MLEKIKIEVESIGYASFISSNSLTVGQEDGYDSQLNCRLLKNTFGIEVRNNLLIVDYAIGQIPVEKEFKTIKELLKFVRQVFPIGD
ncbi:hypothetical protein HHL23_13760 [Chryseobacterium sp. RP-3-3]|uniref:Uncharacterized protein n=1 Tax=Chryseobacterium antibioticum TaxID=2728847 RepID=A0A7Y0AP04_9FLAO|nr:hypothetical protein [Chryseobacterium antibioticum]NML70851.1 hypothetical protein [Chryseobacterium antibioticum]